MKKALAIAGILALSITPTASFADHLEPQSNQLKPGGTLFHTNMRGRNLSGFDLSGARLNNANLSGASLINTNFTGAILTRADFTHARMNNTVFNGSNLSGANVSGTDLNGVTATNLRGCPSSLPRGWVCQNRSLIRR